MQTDRPLGGMAVGAIAQDPIPLPLKGDRQGPLSPLPHPCPHSFDTASTCSRYVLKSPCPRYVCHPHLGNYPYLETILIWTTV